MGALARYVRPHRPRGVATVYTAAWGLARESDVRSLTGVQRGVNGKAREAEWEGRGPTPKLGAMGEELGVELEAKREAKREAKLEANPRPKEMQMRAANMLEFA